MTIEKFQLTVSELGSSNWLLATSDELPELFVQGKDLDQIRERAPNVVRRLLERKGKHIEDVTIEPSAPRSPTHVVARHLTAVATLLAA